MSSTFWVIGDRQGTSSYVTVFGSYWGLRTDPEPGSVSMMGSKFSTPERALAVYDALEADMFGRSGHVYEVTVGPHGVGFEYVAGPLIGLAPPAVAAADPQLAMSPLGSSIAATPSFTRSTAVGM